METAPPLWAICSNTELSSQSVFFPYIQSEPLLLQFMTIVLILPPCTAIKLRLLSSLLKNNWQAAARCSRTGAQAGEVQFLRRSAPALNCPGHPLLNLCQFIDPSCTGDSKTGHNILDVLSKVCPRCRTLHSSLSNFRRLLLIPSSNLLMAALPSNVSAAPPGWHHLPTWSGCTPPPPPRNKGITQDWSKVRHHFSPASRKGMNHNGNRFWSRALRTSCFMQKVLSVSHSKRASYNLSLN